MTDIAHSHNKTDRQVFFSTQLNWLHNSKGIITARDVKDTLYVGLPRQFGGDGENWSPEHILLASVSSCFMTTCMAFARKMNLTITHLDCDASAQVILEAGRYGLAHINLWPVLYIQNTADREKAEELLLKTQQYCIIGNALRQPVIYHGQVSTQAHPVMHAAAVR